MQSQTEFRAFSPTYGYHPILVRRQKRKMQPVLVIFAFIATVSSLVFIILKLAAPSKSNAVIISPLAEGSQPLSSPTPSEPPLGATLAQTVLSNLKDKDGIYAVIIKNLNSGEEFKMNEEKQFESASLYKLWVMAVTFDNLNRGTLQEDQVLNSDIATLNDKFQITSDDAELKEGEISLTVKQALEQMITISHNYAALLLASKVKLPNISSFLLKTGMRDSQIGSPPKTTAADTALFYERLYKGKIVNEQMSQKMIDLLSHQKLNDRIPKYLPPNIQIAHKTGELGGTKHDAGIVFSQNGDYIFVVLSDSKSPADAAENTAILSKAVYEYFNKKQN